jgi:uncharacterized protein (TIGR03437 family)
VDSSGTVFFTQFSSAAVWRLAPSGTLDVYSGNPDREGISNEGVVRTAALFGNGIRVTGSPSGGLIVADSRNGRLRSITNTVDTIAGSGAAYRGDGEPAVAALLSSPWAIAESRNRVVYFSDPVLRVIFSISSSGVLERFAGSGELNAAFVDARPRLQSSFGTPYGIAIDPIGNVYVADDDCSIRRIAADGVMRLFAGAPMQCGTSPDGRTLRDVRFGRLRGLAFDGAGNLYASDITNQKVWRLAPNGIVTTYVGTGEAGSALVDTAPTRTALDNPSGLAATASGTVFIADSANSRILRVEGNRVTSMATGLLGPSGLALDASGNLFVSEVRGHRVQRFPANGAGSAFAGVGSAGYSGDGLAANRAEFSGPNGLAVTSNGTLLVADSGNGRIRAILSSPPAIWADTKPREISLSPSETRAIGSFPISSAVAGIAFTIDIRYQGERTGWLRVSPERGSLPATINYEADTAELPEGDYAASIVISVPTATPKETALPLTLRVPSAGPPGIGVAISRLTLSTLLGTPVGQAIPVRNTGDREITISSSIVQGDFLSIAPSAIRLSRGESAAFAVTADPSTRTVGTYNGGALLSGDNNVNAIVPVSLTVANTRTRLILSQTGLTFRAVSGGGNPLPQPVTVIALGATPIRWQASASGAPWLTATPARGTATAGSEELSRIEVGVVPAGLATGDHFAKVEVTDLDNPSNRHFLSVLLQVLPAGVDPGPEIVPASLVFAVPPGEPAGAQETTIYIPTNRTSAFTTSSLTLDGGAWLRHLPTSGSASGSAPGRLIIQPLAAALSPGIYRGSVTLLFEDGQSRTISVMTVVGSGGSADAKSRRRDASACSSTTLHTQIISPANSFLTTVGQPVRLSAKVVDGCGNSHQPEAGGTAGVSVSGVGVPTTALVHIGGGVWEATWTPQTEQASTSLVFLAVFARGTFIQAGGDRRIGVVAAASRPILFAESVTDAASYQSGAAVAPGSLVTLFGANLNTAEVAAGGIPLPRQLGDLDVRIGTQTIPLLYAGPGQVNAQIPFDVPAETELQLEVRRGSNAATPQRIVISKARPAIFTVDQSGSGQGHIYKTLSDGTTRLATGGDGVRAGDTIIVYANGLGETTPAVLAGTAAPSEPLASAANPVSLEIGKVSATVVFAGLVPGLTGVFQLNAVVPAGVPPGEAVEVLLRSAGQVSSPVTLSVK